LQVEVSDGRFEQESLPVPNLRCGRGWVHADKIVFAEMLRELFVRGLVLNELTGDDPFGLVVLFLGLGDGNQNSFGSRGGVG